jgi:hypothetical protein
VTNALSVLDVTVTVACDVVASTPEILSPRNTSWIRAFLLTEKLLDVQKDKGSCALPSTKFKLASLATVATHHGNAPAGFAWLILSLSFPRV